MEPPSKVTEKAEVSGTGVIKGDSWIHGRAIVADSPTIEDCDIRAYAIVTGTPYISQSLLDEHVIVSGSPSITQSMFAGTSRIQDSAIVNRSIVDGNALIGKRALVQNSHLAGNVVVVGGELHDVNLSNNERVHEGVWHREPRHLSHPDVPMSITECVRGQVIIGCLCRSVEWWKHNAERMQTDYGWTDEAVQWVRDNIDFVAYGESSEEKAA